MALAVDAGHDGAAVDPGGPRCLTAACCRASRPARRQLGPMYREPSSADARSAASGRGATVADRPVGLLRGSDENLFLRRLRMAI